MDITIWAVYVFYSPFQLGDSWINIQSFSVEETIAIIAATIPTLRPFFRLLSDKYTSWSSRTSGDRKNDTAHSEDQQRLNNLGPSKVSHPLELQFRSDLESQTITVTTTTRNDSDTASDRNTVTPVSEGDEGIRKTAIFTASSF